MAALIGVAVGYFGSGKYRDKMEAAVLKAQEYLTTYKDALVKQFGQETYDEMVKVVGDAYQSLHDEDKLAKTLQLVSDAYPLAKKIVQFVAKMLAKKV